MILSPLPWQSAVRSVVSNTTVFATTVAILKDFYKHLQLEIDVRTVMDVVEATDFFKPEGLSRLAKELGMEWKELEEYEIKLGIRARKKSS